MRPSAEAPPDTSQEFQRRATARIVERLVRLRLAIAPLLMLIGVFVAWTDPAPWRRALSALLPLVVLAGSWYAAERVRRGGVGANMLDANLTFNAFGQVSLVVLTGGIESPLAPTFPLMAMVLSLLASPRVAAAVVLGFQAPAIVALALLQRSSRVPSLLPAALIRAPYTAASPALLGWKALSLVLLLAATVALGRLVRATLVDISREIDAARDAQLDAHLEQNRALTTLTGEIAHELKNPLATVKGLAAMLARGAEGKGAERIAVLRREVDRMEQTLEEFLNFSRPLVPIALEPVDLAALARDVLALHEGMAAERDVRLSLDDSGAAPVRCDPRKVRQVLVNVLQNALDASPEGASVTVETALAQGGGARVTVRDQGPGVAPTVASRVFEAGVTTKARGSGLGLTVARALARQHGGDLTLRSGPEGGCVAEVTLPDAPPAEATAKEAL